MYRDVHFLQLCSFLLISKGPHYCYLLYIHTVFDQEHVASALESILWLNKRIKQAITPDFICPLKTWKYQPSGDFSGSYVQRFNTRSCLQCSRKPLFWCHTCWFSTLQTVLCYEWHISHQPSRKSFVTHAWPNSCSQSVAVPLTAGQSKSDVYPATSSSDMTKPQRPSTLFCPPPVKIPERIVYSLQKEKKSPREPTVVMETRATIYKNEQWFMEPDTWHNDILITTLRSPPVCQEFMKTLFIST